MLTSFKNSMSGSQQQSQPSRRRRAAAQAKTADVFRDALKIKRLRKNKVLLQSEEVSVDASQGEQLVADHEWASMLHNFEHEPDAHASGAEDELWERLDSTRWLKAATPEEGADPV